MGKNYSRNFNNLRNYIADGSCTGCSPVLISLNGTNIETIINMNCVKCFRITSSDGITYVCSGGCKQQLIQPTQPIKSVAICKKNCKVVSDCDGSCKQ
jgi:hypothetical protein